MLGIFILLSWLTMSNADTATSTTVLNSTNTYGGNQDVCQIWKNMTSQEVCDYVNYHDDICEGGGYLLWSQYVECQFDTAKKIAVIIAGFLWMLMLFVMVSTTADDFFSPSVSSIVAHLKISESIAGVTFMAFGNGAPDIFGSIASVLSSPKPKAGLALGELLGAGIFVTSVVTATIILTRPFKIDIFATIRDLIFYLIALGWILFVFLYSHQVYIWEPSGYLGLYAIYIITVIVGYRLHKRKRKHQRENSLKKIISNVVSRHGSIYPSVPEINVISDAVKKLKAENLINGDTVDASEHKDTTKRVSIAINDDTLNIFPLAALEMAATILEKSAEIGDSDEDEFVVSHNQVYTGHEARSRAVSIAQHAAANVTSRRHAAKDVSTSWDSPPPVQVVSVQAFFYDLVKHLHPLPTDWDKQNWLSKILSVVKMPAMVFLKLTIPLNETSWSKAVAIIQAICAPQWLLVALQYWTFQPFNGSPGLYAYALIFSAIIVVLISFFTSMGIEPRYYKEAYSYLGFIMSISWIYFISSEIVNVVTMFGVISQISHEVLGLTILAWSNSIGDLIADISVVKQGYPRMAMAASIGGPLFNLLMGFGLPFLIAKAKGRTVTIDFNPTYKILVLFLGISLTTTLIGCFVQRFYLRRPHGIVLILIYLAFITMIILTETNVVVWN
ncbi:Mitochondrial sodium/calcium exchanger protein [Trichostrongylus colubriformis]|uniref:Mitochondrial sodium/calcium exchanger protein n=1 Tax=Trichostrongylus colubriformis TaxID=6319 RepID=A0AAN8FMB4_TRICO